MQRLCDLLGNKLLVNHNTMAEYTYKEPTKEEGDAFNKDFLELSEKHSLVLHPVPFITQDGRIDARVNLLKKTIKSDDGSTTEASSKAD